MVTLFAGQQGGRPVLSVTDQGPGFAAARAQAGTDGRESHGMGLAFVRAILKRHGAAMTIDDAAPGAVVTAQFSR
jgi:nitrogen fixation/metabolism regulation signal transduction histidine kinase